jgi:hypothetical protein
LLRNGMPASQPTNQWVFQVNNQPVL